MSSTPLIAITLAALCFVSACGKGTTAPPKLPDLKVVTDNEVKAATKYVYGVLQATIDEVNAASQLEDDAKKLGSVPDSLDAPVRHLFVDIATKIKSVTQDIDKGVLKDWPTIQQRVNPILDDAQQLVELAKSSSPSRWTNILSIGFGLLLQLLGSGALNMSAGTPAA